MLKVSAYFKLIRFVMCFIAFLMALEGYWLVTRHFDLSVTALLTALTVGTAYAFSNVLNDLFDVETDRVNCPTRPIPAGAVTQLEVSLFAGALFGASLLFSFLASWRLFLITLLFLILATGYNIWAKKIPVLGKLIVATLSAMALAAAYFVVTDGTFPVIPVAVVLFFILAREFISTISDAAGDQIGGRSSIYALWGKQSVLNICLVLTLISIMTLALPLFIDGLSRPWLYLLTISLLSILPVLLGTVAIWRDQSPMNIRRISSHMRYVLLTTVISLLWLV